MRFRNTLPVLAALILTPVAAAAHHNVSARFDTSQIVEIEGELTQIRWQNPHVTFEVAVGGDNGNEEIWKIETNSVSHLSRMDLSPDIFELGERVRLAGNPAKGDENALFVLNMQLEDMQEVLLAPGAESRFSAETIGNSDLFFTAGSDADPASGIFRVWSSTHSSPMLIPETVSADFDLNSYPLTRGARLTAAAFDPADSPLLDCNPKGMPTIMEQPYPMGFIDNGDTITLRLEEYDTVRTIDISGGAAPANPAPRLVGYSMGRWEGDTLVVTTTNANWPYFDTVGIPLIQIAQMIEYFTLSADGSRLDYSIIVEDRSIFTEPVTLEKHWVWLPENTVQPYDCTVQQNRP